MRYFIKVKVLYPWLTVTNQIQVANQFLSYNTFIFATFVEGQNIFL